jgi:tetratricopeptide (TPR) repeat protein
MMIRKILWLAVLSGMIVGCGAPKVLVPSYKDDAKLATSQGDYTKAIEAWKQHFNQTTIEETAGKSFAEAAKIAFKGGETDLALSWFDQAGYKFYSDAEMYSTLANIYKSKKNISKELSALEYFTDSISATSKEINERLFDVYAEIDLHKKALQIWDRLDESAKNETSKLSTYFLIHKELKDTTVCDSVSLVLLEKKPSHAEALDWNAKKLYWLGENRYTSEMAKYEKNKTTRQYKVLLKELDLATADFKKSLVYFEKLWKINPGKKYASYFANIYARFGNEKKSKYYQGLMK